MDETAGSDLLSVQARSRLQCLLTSAASRNCLAQDGHFRQCGRAYTICFAPDRPLEKKRKWPIFHSTRKQAQDKLADLLKEEKDGTGVDPSMLKLAAAF